MWRKRRWRFLLNLIEHLPGDSHFAEACADDEQYAAVVLDQRPDQPPRPPRLSEWSPVVAELAMLSDMVGSLIVAVTAGNGQRVHIPAHRYPETAADRLRRVRVRDRHRALVDRLTPDLPI